MSKKTIREILEYRFIQTPDAIFGIYEKKPITYSSVWHQVNQIASGLTELGVGPGDRVALMLTNHPDHIFSVFAIACLGAVWIPINIHLKGMGLDYILEQSSPKCLIIEEKILQKQLLSTDKLDPKRVVIRREKESGIIDDQTDFQQLFGKKSKLPEIHLTETDLRCISYTSGTTGPPKGVYMTEKMLFTCSRGAAAASEVQPGDVYLLWEPIYHNSGVQMCLLALMEEIRLVITPRFSASRFWSLVREHKVTKLHYLGGIIDILLKQPPTEDDRNHDIKISFGAGCSKENWQLFEDRFGVKINEVYGLTEASGFTTLNTTGKVGSIGRALPYFDVKLVQHDSSTPPVGQVGEILIREKIPGLITKGYHNNPEATSQTLKDGWLHTGDLGFSDEDGDLYYLGRTKDCIRRRGENISAWEVERVLNMHPEVIDSAVIGVQSEVGEQDVKAFLNTAPGSSPNPIEIIQWCETRMPYYQIPRYIEFVESFERTPTQRIRKTILPHESSGCWDLEKSGYKVKRL